MEPCEFEQVAVEWFKAISEAFGPAIEHRERTLISAPAVLAAIGAVEQSPGNGPTP